MTPIQIDAAVQVPVSQLKRWVHCFTKSNDYAQVYYEIDAILRDHAAREAFRIMGTDHPANGPVEVTEAPYIADTPTQSGECEVERLWIHTAASGNRVCMICSGMQCVGEDHIDHDETCCASAILAALRDLNRLREVVGRFCDAHWDSLHINAGMFREMADCYANTKAAGEGK
jgi:hypothetical protein